MTTTPNAPATAVRTFTAADRTDSTDSTGTSDNGRTGPAAADAAATDVGRLYADTVPVAFARTVAAYPDHEALSDGVTTWTYRQLDALARGIAGALHARGLTPGQRVGMYFERCAETYPLLLGILRAGLVAVPFNPDHPASYIGRMHRIAAPAVTVTGEDPVGGTAGPDVPGPDVPGRDGPRVPEATALPMAQLLAEARGPAGDHPVTCPGPEDAAVVLFTSGSTGTPKGVEIVHRGLARVARGLRGYEPGPGDRFLQLAQPSFAASTTDIWTCLLRGGRLTVAPQQAPAPAELAQLADAEGITVLNLPVGLFNRLVEQQPRTVARARWVIVSGDFPSAWHLRRGLEVTGGTLFNAFGCTENSALTAVHPITAADLDGAAVPVGHPMPGVAMTVRDEELREVPPGETGELCLAGAGLARGYLGDPAQTAAKFVEHDGDRLLRTGDLACRGHDGGIVLAGRTDQMVKVRGFRVEPRQVELAAESVPGIGRALVQAAPGAGAAEELALWFTARDDAVVGARELTAALRAELPGYMVPSTVTALEAFPLNANGKIDRQALVARLAERATTVRKEETAGNDPLTRTVQDLLAEVTGDPAGDPDAGLFDSGVTSLHLIDLGARLEDLTGTVMAPDDLVGAGTVRAIADRIRDDRGEGLT